MEAAQFISQYNELPFDDEVLVKEWREFLARFGTVLEITGILWFRRSPAEALPPSERDGAYPDSEDSAYLFAETPLYREDTEGLSPEELIAYITGTQKEYTGDLYPAFFVKAREG